MNVKSVDVVRFLQKLGCDSVLITAVGEDSHAKYFFDNCKHINLSLVEKVPEIPTAVYLSMNNKGHVRYGISSIGKILNQITPELVDRHAHLIEESDYLVLDGNIPVETISRAIQIANYVKTPVLFEPTDIKKVSKVFDSGKVKGISANSPNANEFRQWVKGCGLRLPESVVSSPYHVGEFVRSHPSVMQNLDLLIVSLAQHGAVVIQRFAPASNFSKKMRRAIRLIREMKRPFVFGMIHVPALPGTPCNQLSMKQILEVVRKETAVYSAAKVDGIIVENMHDIPYVRAPVGPEITSAMSLVCQEVNNTLGSARKDFVLGVQILAGSNKEAIAVAHNTGFDLIRVECFVFSHVADEGWMDGCAGDLLRYRRSIGADDVAVITDIKKKHSSHSVTADLSIGDIASAAQFFLADGVIVTGSATGQSANPKDIQDVQKSSSLPVFVGSGLTSANLADFSAADSFIVGSEFKKNGKWQNELEPERIRKFMENVAKLG